jgi:hypothetical protein
VRHLGVEKAGRHRVHGDAEPADLARERAGEAEHCGLGRRIDRKAAVTGEADVPRGDRGLQETAARYRDVAELWDSRLDGLVVTGTEPRTADLRDEP